MPRIPLSAWHHRALVAVAALGLALMCALFAAGRADAHATACDLPYSATYFSCNHATSNAANAQARRVTLTCSGCPGHFYFKLGTPAGGFVSGPWYDLSWHTMANPAGAMNMLISAAGGGGRFYVNDFN